MKFGVLDVLIIDVLIVEKNLITHKIVLLVPVQPEILIYNVIVKILMNNLL